MIARAAAALTVLAACSDAGPTPVREEQLPAVRAPVDAGVAVEHPTRVEGDISPWRLMNRTQRASSKLELCLRASGAATAKLALVIDGPTGKVTSLLVDGADAGALHACLLAALQTVQYETVTTPVNRGELDLRLER